MLIHQKSDINTNSTKRKIPFWAILLVGIIAVIALDALTSKPSIPKIKNTITANTSSKFNAKNTSTFQPDILKIQVTDQTKNKLVQQTKAAFKEGILIATDEHWVKGEITSTKADKTLPVKLRLKGDWLDHLRGNKWSFRIRAKTDYAWNRLVTFSVQNPATRSYLDEWLFHQFLEKADILSPRYDFIELYLNEKSLSFTL